MPNTRPAPAPVSIARHGPERRRPACTAMNARPAITPAAGQCENEPKESPIGFADRDADSSATPAHSTTAPKISVNRSDALAIGTERIRAKTRFTVSSGSTNASDRLPIDQAARICPPIMHPMPVSQRGECSRSMISRKERNRDDGSPCAAFCCRTRPAPTKSAASSVRA